AQRREHAVHAVRRLTHVLEQEHAAVHGWRERCTRERREHREVAADERRRDATTRADRGLVPRERNVSLDRARPALDARPGGAIARRCPPGFRPRTYAKRGSEITRASSERCYMRSSVLDSILDWLRHHEGPLAYVVVGLASLIEYVFPPFPGDAIAIFAISLV